MSSPDIEITWVNHASFIFSDGRIRLLCDPWLRGSAFNNGWRHIAQTRLAPEDFAGVTHLWLSHQHPDHFAPQDLRRVPVADRRRIEVLYQTVPDKLVVSWLRSAGFARVSELQMDRWLPLSEGVEVLCGSLGEDSWLALRACEKTLLNVNDCVLKRRSDLERIHRLVGRVDVLFTQFSYAQWVGNANETERRKRDAEEKLQRLALQCEILDPGVVVPFASFVYFSNTENFFMNDAMNRVARVARFIEQELGRRAVVLYPGERWRAGETPDWRPAAQRYEADLEQRLAAGAVDVPVQTDPLGFFSQVQHFFTRMHRKNRFIDLLLRERTSFYLTDHCRAFTLTSRGLKELAAGPREVDIATSSENVLYAFRMPWGGNTLHVSGRFQSFVAGGHLRFFDMMSKLQYYNRTAIDARWLAHQWARGKRVLGRRLRRVSHADEAHVPA